MSQQHTHYGKKRRLTPKRQKLIDETWPKYERYQNQMKELGIYEGIYWSADRKNKPIHIDTKEKFTESMLTQHCISHTFLLDIERIT